jgi:hypothetical protein
MKRGRQSISVKIKQMLVNKFTKKNKGTHPKGLSMNNENDIKCKIEQMCPVKDL